jgi:hypothetical protein
MDLVWSPTQLDKNSCVQIASEEDEQSKIRDPSRLVVSQVPDNEGLRQYEEGQKKPRYLAPIAVAKSNHQ